MAETFACEVSVPHSRGISTRARSSLASPGVGPGIPTCGRIYCSIVVLCLFPTLICAGSGPASHKGEQVITWESKEDPSFPSALLPNKEDYQLLLEHGEIQPPENSRRRLRGHNSMIQRVLQEGEDTTLITSIRHKEGSVKVGQWQEEGQQQASPKDEPNSPSARALLEEGKRDEFWPILSPVYETSIMSGEEPEEEWQSGFGETDDFESRGGETNSGETGSKAESGGGKQ
ncbi:unnamed protein product, partial [Discosporangium mesarthrocarpum]